MQTHAESLLSNSSTLLEVLKRLALFSKTSQRLLKLMENPHSYVCSKGPMKAGILFRGEFSTLDNSDSPLAANAFLLSDIVENPKPLTAPCLSHADLHFLIRKRQLPRKLAEQIALELSRLPPVQSR